MRHLLLFILLFVVLFNQGCKTAHTDIAGVTTVGPEFNPEESGLVEFGVDGKLDSDDGSQIRSVHGVQFDVLQYKGDWDFIPRGPGGFHTAYCQASGSKMIFKAKFVRFGILFAKPSTYENPGIVSFTVDGESRGSVDLSGYNPADAAVAPYVFSVIDGSLDHTVEMTIATGAVTINGYQATFIVP